MARGKLAECKGTNPLIWAAALAAFGLTMDAFALVTSHTLSWSTIVAAVLLLAFLVFYLRRSPLAWWFIPTWGAFSLTQIPFIHATSEARLRVGIGPHSLSVSALSFMVWLSDDGISRIWRENVHVPSTPTSNRSLELTASRRTTSLSMTRTLSRATITSSLAAAQLVFVRC